MLAPDFTVATNDNRTNRLSDFRGHPVVLSFQACRWDPTRAEQVDLFNRLMTRFLGPGEPLVRITREGVWCRLHFRDGEAELPLLAPLAPDGEVAQTYGVAGCNAVFVVGGDGLIRWRHMSRAEEPQPSSEVMHALAQLAPVLQARQRRGTVSRRDCAATMLAAAAVCAVRPRRTIAA
jgi:peroxiredoxin